MSAASSDWRRLSAQALREGRSLKAASEAYRHANRHTRGNPTSGETEHRRWRTGELGELLRRGVPFHEARRMVEHRNPGEWWALEPAKGSKPPPHKCQACGRIFKTGEKLRKHMWDTHAAKRNPDLDELEHEVERDVPTFPGEPRGLREKPWLVIAGVAAAAYLLYQGSLKRAAAQAPAIAAANSIQGGQPVQGQLATDSPYGHQTGSYQSSMDPTSAIPGGVATNTTVSSPWDVGI